jgi:archaellin
MVMREFKYTFTVICAGSGTADLEQVENLIDLSMQDLVYDDEFVAALDEKEAVTIQVTPNFGQAAG